MTCAVTGCENDLEQIQRTVQIDLFPDVQMIFRFCHVIQQKFKNYGAAQTPALNLELGETVGQPGFPNVLNADESGVPHRVRKAVAPSGIRRNAEMIRVL